MFSTLIAFRVRRAGLALAVVAASLALVACGDSDEDPTPTVTPTPTATQVTGGGAADAPTNVDATACDGLEPLVAGAFSDVEVHRDVTAFEAGGTPGQGCRVMVLGDGDDLPTFVEVSQALRAALEADGWQEDIQFAADGPTGTQTVYTKGEQQVLVAAGVSPTDPSACPSDQVISECLEGLEPDEVLVQGSLVLMLE